MNATVLLQAQQGGMWTSLIMIVLIFVVMYFFMIRPNVKKQKEIKKFRDGLSVNDKVITAGGIYGKIKDIKEKTILLEISDNVKIKIDKNSVYPSAEDAQTDVAAEKK